jgi:N-acetylmuramoyl-L-alanine amidase
MIPAPHSSRRFRRAVFLVTPPLVWGLLLSACSGDPVDPAGPEAASTRGGVTTAAPSADHSSEPAPTPRTTETAATFEPEPELPLAGRVVVLDPGHQLGNSAFRAQVNAPVDAGGFTKACNTTGTATDAGYPEATFNWEVALETRRLLRRLGARVLLTRSSNSPSEWGPCVDERGRAGNPDQPGPTADVKVSIHADGSLSPGAHGFHVIVPREVAPWTTDIAAPSLRLAEVVRDTLVDDGFATSTYAGSDGIDFRGDLGTLNLSDVPVVLVELGNMRDAGDAAMMTSADGRKDYASALADAVARYVAL